jgi:hypothetical protein
MAGTERDPVWTWKFFKMWTPLKFFDVDFFPRRLSPQLRDLLKDLISIFSALCSSRTLTRRFRTRFLLLRNRLASSNGIKMASKSRSSSSKKTATGKSIIEVYFVAAALKMQMDPQDSYKDIEKEAKNGVRYVLKAQYGVDVPTEFVENFLARNRIFTLLSPSSYYFPIAY